LQTEDTGTQGAGNVEFENGLSRSQVAGGSSFEYAPQLSFGVLPALDLLVQASRLSQYAAGSGRVRGWGDTNLDAKWRFFRAAPVSFALRGGVALPTGTHGLGLHAGTLAAHALLVASIDAAPFALHGNLGYARAPAGSGRRKELGHVSSALMWAASERLTLALEGAADSHAERSRSSWPATVLAGAVWTIQPGLDVDLGVQSVVRSASPSSNWLVGLTYRFTP